MPAGPSTWTSCTRAGARSGSSTAFRSASLEPGAGQPHGTRAVIWSHGGSVQDANENVVLNSPETIAAVKYYAGCRTTR